MFENRGDLYKHKRWFTIHQLCDNVPKGKNRYA